MILHAESLQESLEDIVAEGVMAFAVKPAKFYRYVIELKNSEMSIWIEDRTSKKQWFKGGMATTEYVSSANAIPNASAADYVKTRWTASWTILAMPPLKGGAVQLELSVAIRVLRAMCVAKYTFDLDPVSVERIDILESKFRDQQDELEKLRGDLSEAHPFVKLTTSQKIGSSMLCWNSIESDAFISTGLDGKIKIVQGGVYSIGILVITIPGSSQKVELLKNAIAIQVAYPGYSRGCNCSTTLYTIERLEKDDELTTCLYNLADSGYLSIVRLDN